MLNYKNNDNSFKDFQMIKISHRAGSYKLDIRKFSTILLQFDYFSITVQSQSDFARNWASYFSTKGNPVGMQARGDTKINLSVSGYKSSSWKLPELIK